MRATLNRGGSEKSGGSELWGMSFIAAAARSCPYMQFINPTSNADWPFQPAYRRLAGLPKHMLIVGPWAQQPERTKSAMQLEKPVGAVSPRRFDPVQSYYCKTMQKVENSAWRCHRYLYPLLISLIHTVLPIVPRGRRPCSYSLNNQVTKFRQGLSRMRQSESSLPPIVTGSDMSKTSERRNGASSARCCVVYALSLKSGGDCQIGSVDRHRPNVETVHPRSQRLVLDRPSPTLLITIRPNFS